MDPKEEIKDIAPKLSLWKYKEGFQVPEGYFENLSNSVQVKIEERQNLDPYFDSLPDQVMNRIEQENSKKIISIQTYLKYAVAALFFVSIGTLLWNNIQEDITTPSLAIIEDTEEIDYIIESISIEDIFNTEFIDDADLDEIFANEDDDLFLIESVEEVLHDAEDALLEEFL